MGSLPPRAGALQPRAGTVFAGDGGAQDERPLARDFKLADRSEIREGAFADVVVFDAATVKDVATFERPKAVSVGIECVMVNGAMAYRAGEVAN